MKGTIKAHDDIDDWHIGDEAWRAGLDAAYLDRLYRRRDAIDRAINDHVEHVRQRWYAEFWQKKHAQQQNASIKHNEIMIGNLLLATLNGNLVPKPLPGGMEPLGLGKRGSK